MNSFLSKFVHASFILLVGVGSLQKASADQYDNMRAKVTQVLTGSALYTTPVTDPGLQTKITNNDLAVSSTPTAAPNSSGTGFWDTLNTDPSRINLWADLPILNGTTFNDAALAASYTRLYSMTVATQTPGSSFYGTGTIAMNLKSTIISALDFLNTNYYKSTDTSSSYQFNPIYTYPNNQKVQWYYWKIQIPQLLGKMGCLLYSNLSSTEISNYTTSITILDPTPTDQTMYNSPTMTASNLMDQSLALTLVGILDKDTYLVGTESILNLVRYTLLNGSGTLPYRTDNITSYNTSNRDGFYSDGSFLQHFGIAYIAGYGQAMLTDMSTILYYFIGTSYEINDANSFNQRSNLYAWVIDTDLPAIWQGNYVDAFWGRNIAVGPSLGLKQYYPLLNTAQYSAIPFTTLADVLLVPQTTGIGGVPNPPLAVKEALKYQLSVDTNNQILNAATIFTYLTLENIVNDNTVPVGSSFMGYEQFAQEDRVQQGRPNYQFVVAMNSKRTLQFEAAGYINPSLPGTNFKAWYTGDGMTYLYTSDNTRYYNWWQTVNSYRMPGTTEDTLVRQPAPSFSRAFVSPNSWVGGADVDATYGATGMDFQGAGDFGANGNTTINLKAKKSWFFFDDEMVALGAGISESNMTGNGWDGAPRRVETTVENYKLNSSGNNAITVNGIVEPTTFSSGTYTGVNWLYLQGNTSGDTTSLGYYFPTATNLAYVREARTGSYRDINTGYSNSFTRFPAADSYVESGNPTFNHGTATTMIAWNYSNTREAYIKFDLTSAIQDNNSIIGQAIVNLPVVSVGSGTPMTDVADILTDDSWTEAGITWNNRPTASSATLGPWTITSSSVNTAIPVDITTALQAAIAAGKRTISLHIRTTSASNVNGAVNYGTRENSTFANRPTLVVTGYVEPTTSNYQTFTINHGSNPTAGSYAYVTLPNRSSAAVQAYATTPQISVLENDTTIQAVKETTLGVTGANFWASTGGALSVSGATFLTSDSPSSVVTWEQSGTLKVSVSNPPQTPSATVNVEINRSATSVITSDSGITVNQLSPTVKLAVLLNDSNYNYGLNKQITLQTGPVNFSPTDDAYVYQGSPTTNYGTATELAVKNTGTDNYETLYQFDMTGYTGTVSHAVINLTTTYIPMAGLQDQALAVTGAWTEGSVTWNTKPATGALVASWTVPAAGNVTSIDVTSLVQAAVSGSNKKVSIDINSITTGNYNHKYASKENATTSYRPTLTITP